ncbi:hypothetical protein [Vampirovibrio sp.]|uniref:hypothetical protein n=1 Tax=Vampirovibrio sp. TaxID=2717857 RepID=UPI003592F50D
MTYHDPDQTPDDIQAALDSANQRNPETQTPAHEALPSEVLTQGATSCPLLSIRYAFTKCGLMAEKAPWQTLSALALAIGCGWVCNYFGVTVLAGLIAYAIVAEE